MNHGLQALLDQVNVNTYSRGLGALATALGILGALVGIIIAVLQLAPEPKFYNEDFPGATKVVVTSESKPFNPQQCIISEGLSTEMVHRFDANGEYFAKLDPGENRLKVICFEPGLGTGSSEKDAKVRFEGTSTFSFSNGEPGEVKIAVK